MTQQITRRRCIGLLAAFACLFGGSVANDWLRFSDVSEAQAQSAPAKNGQTKAKQTPGKKATPTDTAPSPNSAGTTGTAPAGGELLQEKGATEKPTKFTPVTKEASDAAIDQAKRKSAFVAKELKITLFTLETDHFIIFTDWAKGDHTFLKTNMEQAYTAVSRQFDIPVSQNVFIGKLPVYMFDTEADFQQHARKFDKFDATKVLGYYAGNARGEGAMAMWKPKVGNQNELKKKQRDWAYTLVHEFTHAFVARYRTNAFIPRWLNEGLAEVIASGQFPQPEVYPYVRARSKQVNVRRLINQTGMLAGEDYPVVRTLVETMVRGNRKGFLQLFNDVKDGMTFEDALRKNFRTDVNGLDQSWRQYMITAK